MNSSANLCRPGKLARGSQKKRVKVISKRLYKIRSICFNGTLTIVPMTLDLSTVLTCVWNKWELAFLSMFCFFWVLQTISCIAVWSKFWHRIICLLQIVWVFQHCPLRLLKIKIIGIEKIWKRVQSFNPQSILVIKHFLKIQPYELEKAACLKRI